MFPSFSIGGFVCSMYALCIIGGVTVVCGAVFAVVKLCSKKEQKKSKKKK